MSLVDMRRILHTSATVVALCGLSACGASAADTLGAAPGQPPAPQSEYAVPAEGSVSGEQAQRPGLDGRDACAASTVQDWLAQHQADGAAATRFLAGFLTDGVGLAKWGAELTGGELEIHDPGSFSSAGYALCWYQGDFLLGSAESADDGSAGTGAPAEAADNSQSAQFVVLQVPLAAGERITVTAASPKAMGVFAPPAPARSGAGPAATTRTYDQPDGVRERPRDPRFSGGRT